MNGIGKKIEIIANLAIIAVAIMIGIVSYQKYFKTPETVGPPAVPIGKKIALSNVDWAKNKKTIIIALQEGCRYCSESAPFYQKLIPEAEKNNIPIVAVLPHTPDQSQKYLAGIKVSIREIRQSTLDAINVKGTPSLFIVNDKGEVAKGWIGKLPANEEDKVIKQIF